MESTPLRTVACPVESSPPKSNGPKMVPAPAGSQRPQFTLPEDTNTSTRVSAIRANAKARPHVFRNRVVRVDEKNVGGIVHDVESRLPIEKHFARPGTECAHAQRARGAQLDAAAVAKDDDGTLPAHGAELAIRRRPIGDALFEPRRDGFV